MRLKNPISHLKVSWAISIGPAIPLLVAVALAVVLISGEQARLRDLDRLSQLVEPVALLSNAVHEQQKERGASSIVIGSKGAEFTAELAAQRKNVDLRQAALVSFLATSTASLDDDLQQRFGTLRAHLAGQDDIRARVDALEIQASEALGYYTEANRQMLEIVNAIGRVSPDRNISIEINAFYNFLQGKERAGIERAIGSLGFARGKFKLEELLRWRALIAAQEAYFGNFRDAAPAEIYAQFELIAASPASQQVTAMRDAAFTKGLFGGLADMNATDFFAAMTQRIEQMKALENTHAAEIAQLTSEHRDAAFLSRNFLITLVVSVLAAVLALTFLLSRSVRTGFSVIQRAATALSDGQYDLPMPKRRDNEFGVLLDALVIFRKTSIENRDRALREQQEAAEAARTEHQRMAEERQAAEAEAERTRAAHAAQMAQVATERSLTAEIAAVVSACAEGEFDRRLSVTSDGGALSEICHGVNRLCDIVETELDRLADVMEALAQGDLTHRVAQRGAGTFGRIAGAVNTAMDSLASSFGGVETSGLSIEGSTREFAGMAHNLATQAEQTAHKLEAASRSIQSLTSSVGAAAENASEANVEASAAMDRVRTGTTLVGDTIAAIREIQNSSAAIGSAIKLIEDITFQTNLLALNAGVEAARAGEAGRGFAVVASEVRDLAQRSASAAQEISGLLGTSLSQVERGVTLVEEAGGALTSISDAVGGIVDRIGQIATASAAQSRDISEISRTTASLEQATQQNAAVFEEASANSRTLQAEAEALARVISAFKIREISTDMRGAA